MFSLTVGVIPTPGTVTLSTTVACSDGNNTSTTSVTLNSWPAIVISSVGVFSDSGCTVPVTYFNSNTTYYAKVVATGGAGAANTYSMTSNNASVVVAQVSGGVFSLTVGTVPTAGTVTLTPTVTCSDGNATTTLSVQVNTPLSITSVTTYSDSGCTIPCSSFYNGVTYYCKVIPSGGGGSQSTDTYTLTSNNANVTIATLGNGIFSLAVGTIASQVTLTMTATVTVDGNSATSNPTATLLAVPVVSITSVTTYSDSGCTVPCSSFYNGVTYYAKIVPSGGGGSQSTDTYTLSSNNSSVVVSAVGNGVFSLAVATPSSGSVILTGTAAYNGSSASTTQTATLLEIPPVTISSVTTYSDAGCTVPCSSFYNGVTYYAQVVPSGGGGSQTLDTYTLSSNNSGVTVSPLGNGVFSLAVGTPSAGTLTLTATATYSASSATTTQTASLLAVPIMSITSVTTYSDSGCTVPCSSFYNGVTYYAKIVPTGAGGSQSTDTYTLTSNNSGVTVTAVGLGIFSLAVGTIASSTTLTLTATAAFTLSGSTSSATTTQTASLLAVSPVTISSVTTYSDAGCTVPCSSFYNGVTYYAKVVAVGGGGTQSGDTYTLNSNNGGVVTTAVGNGIFSLAVGTIASASTLTLTATAAFTLSGSTSIATTTQTASLLAVSVMSISSINTYSDAGCTLPVTVLNNNLTYYCKIVPAGAGGSQTTDTYTLNSNNINVTTLAVGNGVFSVTVGTVPSSATLTLTGTASFTLSGSTSSASSTDVLPLTAQAKISISSITAYSDAGCTIPVSMLNNSTGYYAKIVPANGGGSQSTDTYTLTSNNGGVVVSAVGNGVFSLVVGTIASSGTVTLTGTASFGGSTGTTTSTASLSAQAQISVASIGVFADSGCTTPVTLFNNSTTYYAKVISANGGGSQSTDTYTLTSNNGSVVVTAVGNGVFSLAVGTIASAGTVTLTGTASFGGNTSAVATATPSLSAQAQISVASIGVFADSGCTLSVTQFNNNTTYYAKIVPSGGGGSQTTDTYTLTSNNAGVVPTVVGNGVYSLAVATPSAGTLTLTGTAAFDGNTSAGGTQTVTLSGVAQISISSITTYSDSGCTVSTTSFYNNTTYYAQIISAGGGGSQTNDAYTLTSNNVNVVVTAVGNGIFSLAVGTPSAGTLTLTGAASYGGNIATSTATPSLSGQAQISDTFGTYVDSGCTIPVTVLNNNTTYYAKIVPSGGGGSQTTDTYTLTSNNGGVVVTAVGNGVFSLAVATPSAGTVTFAIAASFDGNVISSTPTVTLSGAAQISISSIGLFSDYGCTKPVTVVIQTTTMYVKIVPINGGGSASTDNYTLTSNNSGVVVGTNEGNGVFQITAPSVTTGVVMLTATAAYGGNVSSQATLTLPILI